MKVFDTRQTRDEYLRTQIERSERKFGFCKVSIRDVLAYRRLLDRAETLAGRITPRGPILCLGSRHGREVDLFRIGFFSSPLRSLAVMALERHDPSFVSLIPPLEAPGRSDVTALTPTSVVGVEVNPNARRSDVWIGSFDDMPRAWEDRFAIVFSNSFDQSQDPGRTAKEWTRVTGPGGYLIICFAKDAEPSLTDPVGSLTINDVMGLFGGELVYYRELGSRNGYCEIILRRRERRP